MTIREELRSHPRFPVVWRVLYGNQEVFGQGTVLNVSHGGCQVAAMMPVAVGMRLKLWIFTSHRKDPLYVGEARVCWAEVHRFGLELGRLHCLDHRWLMSFLENARRNNVQRRPTQRTWQRCASQCR
jgi:PilZ domain-containing protein